jgi:hypothetical protein
VLLTATGTVGGLCFAAWAGADKLWSVSRRGAAACSGPSAAEAGHRTACLTEPTGSQPIA